MATVEIKRTDYEALRKLLLADGPTAFNQKPELLSRSGDNDPAMQAVLDEHLPCYGTWSLNWSINFQSRIVLLCQPPPSPQPPPGPPYLKIHLEHTLGSKLTILPPRLKLTRYPD